MDYGKLVKHLWIVFLTWTSVVESQPANGRKQDTPIARYNAVHHPAIGRRGMVASQNAVASQIGVDILKKGGNAIDAGVAVGIALAVTLPRAGNVGGGGFMLIHIASENRTIAVDFRETAPAAATNDMYFDTNGEVNNSEFRFTHKSSAVPGTVAGFDHILRHYGTMNWEQVTGPAIDLAQNGIVVTEDLANNLANAKERLSTNRNTRSTYYKPNGELYVAGEIFKQPELAWTLKHIAKGGAQAFYRGAIAERIALDMQKHNGLITMNDLANYQVVERTPVVGTFHDYTIAAMSAPSSGGMHILQMLNIFENYPLAQMGYGSADAIHLMAEAMKLAYADRSKYLGDPDFINIPSKALTGKPYADLLTQSISMDKARSSTDILPGNLTPYESPETTHYSILDQQGNAVVTTYTLMFSYGSGVVIKDTGILMNNNMGNFTLRPDIPDAFGLLGSADNQIAPGRRPVSSMTPIIVFKEEKPFLLTGSPGGSRIITTNLQLLLNVLVHKMNIADATSAPRIHHQWYPDVLQLESGFSPDTIQILRLRGHKINFSPAMGSLQTVMFENGTFFGYSDPRRPGAKSIGW